MSLSVMEEVVPDYLIITNEALKPAFQKLADWKTAKGVPAIIKTTEEIMNEYPGSDLPERIRNYLIACYHKWGAGLYVLLGGDYTVIPAKIYLARDTTNRVVVDLYYAATDGSWNIRNPAEYVYCSVNSFQGRASVENLQEAEIFVQKVLMYEKAEGVNLSYYNNLLVWDAFVGKVESTGRLYDQAKCYFKNTIQYPDYIYRWFIFDDASCSGDSKYWYRNSHCERDGQCVQGDQELNRTNVLSALNGGVNQVVNPGSKMFHIIYNMDHGSPGSINTSSKDKGECLTREDAGSLQNGNYLQVFFSGSCQTADFQKDCIAERFLNNPDGGAVAYIGNSDNGYTNENNFLQYFIDAWKNPQMPHNIGNLFRKVQTSGGGGSSNRKMVLLGDPEMPVWSKTPETLDV